MANNNGNTYGYYQPWNDYGGQQWGYGPGDFAQSPLGGQYLEDNHDAAFTRWLSQQGYQPQTNQGEFARGQFGRVDDAYKAALATNPFLTFQQYLTGVGPQMQQQWQAMTPGQRGENPSQFASRARTIPR